MSRRRSGRGDRRYRQRLAPPPSLGLTVCAEAVSVKEGSAKEGSAKEVSALRAAREHGTAGAVARPFRPFGGKLLHTLLPLVRLCQYLHPLVQAPKVPTFGIVDGELGKIVPRHIQRVNGIHGVRPLLVAAPLLRRQVQIIGYPRASLGVGV
jgi:hypothetical protein